MSHIDAVINTEAEIIPPQTAFEMKPSMQEIHSLVGVPGGVCNVGKSPSLDIERHAALLGIESNIDLIVMEIRSQGQ